MSEIEITFRIGDRALRVVRLIPDACAENLSVHGALRTGVSAAANAGMAAFEKSVATYVALVEQHGLLMQTASDDGGPPTVEVVKIDRLRDGR